MQMRKKLKLFRCFIGSLIVSCVQHGECKNYNYQDQCNYEINATEITKSGISVDTSGNVIDLSEIDRLTDEVESCLIEEFGNPAIIPDDVMADSDCVVNTFDIPLLRECIVVKIPSDWTWSCDGTQQLLSCEAPQELCNEKGFEYDPECPCRWRAGIQDNHIIIVTPNLYLYKDPLIRITTGCNNPWAHRKFLKCIL